MKAVTTMATATLNTAMAVTTGTIIQMLSSRLTATAAFTTMATGRILMATPGIQTMAAGVTTLTAKKDTT